MIKDGFGDITSDELKNIQSGLLDLLLEFDSICREHGLTYYLDGGSVIGAMRHEGFVPWDDDVDLLMKRSEFRKLLAVIGGEVERREYRAFSYMGEQYSHHRPFARYVNTGMLHVVRQMVTESTCPPGIFLDIFILDPVPAGKLHDHARKLEESEEWFHKRLNGVVGRMPYWKYQAINALERVIGEQRIFCYFDNQLSAYADDEADYYVPRNGFNYAVYDADVFREPKYRNFEGHLLPVPTKPEKYLRTHYDIDWFLPPPIEARYSEHHTLTGVGISADDFIHATGYQKDQPEIFRVQQKRHKYQVRRKKSTTATKRFIARLKSLCDTLEVQRHLSQYGADKLEQSYQCGEYDYVADVFGLFYERQLEPEYLRHKVTIDIEPGLLVLALGALVETGRLFDAQRILLLHDESQAALSDIAERITAGIQAEEREQDDLSCTKDVIKSMETLESAQAPVNALAEAVFQKELQLLDEFHQLCETHNIRYTLTGGVAVAAVRDGHLRDARAPVTVAMLPSQYKQLLSVSGKLASDRCLEHIFNNGFYPSNSARYVATDTTNYKVTSPWFKAPGIFISVQVIQKPIDNKTVSGWWRGIAKYKKAFCLLPRSLRWVGLSVCVLHRWHINRLLRRDPMDITVPITKGKSGAGVEFTAEELHEYTSVTIDSGTYQMLRALPMALLEQAPWLHYSDLNRVISTQTRVINLSVPYKEYLERIPSGLLYKCYFHGFRSYRVLRKIRRVERHPYSHKHVLLRLAFAFRQFKVWHEYSPKSPDLIRLLSEYRYDELEVLLKPYSEWFSYFYRRNRLLVGHPVVFAAYMELLRWQGKEHLVKHIAQQTKAHR